MTEIVAEQLETEQSMFVQTAQGIESDGAKLTLQGITASTLFFSDRPQRVVGHMATTDFVDVLEGAVPAHTDRHAVHRPVRAAAVARLGLRCASARATRSARDVTPAGPGRGVPPCP